MKKYIAFIAVLFTFSFTMAACESSNNAESDNDMATNETNKNNENDGNNNNNDSNATESENDNEYGEHEIKEHLTDLDSSDGSDDLNLKVTDIYLGELHINDESKIMFQNRDIASTIGLKVELENKSDNTLSIDTDKIRFAEDKNDRGEDPDPIMSDGFNDEIESGETQTGILYYFPDADHDDLTNFNIRSSRLVEDGNGETKINIDINIG